jgi:hypothetical protein
MPLFSEAANSSNGFYEVSARNVFGEKGDSTAYGWRDLHDRVARCTDTRA